MKKNFWILEIYATFILIGGLIGFVKASSTASLISSLASSSLVSLFAYIGYYQDQKWAKSIVFGLLGAICCFFAFRFFKTYAYFPAGIMSLLTLFVLSFLVVRKERKLLASCSSCNCEK